MDKDIKYTKTELLVMLNDLKRKHDNIKENMLTNIELIKEIEVKINNDALLMKEIENEYVLIIEEFYKEDV